MTLQKPAVRWKRHLRQLRGRGHEEEDISADAPEEPSEGPFQSPVQLSGEDYARIQRRVRAILERRKAVSGLDHLTREDHERLEVLRHGARLIAIPTEHQADELASALHGDMPWMGAATEIAWRAMRRSVREGWSGLRLPPLLLDGPPGIGKSYWARRLGELLSTPVAVVEATGENASFGIVGGQRGWSGAYPGRLIETVLHTGTANPVMIVDEVEKAGKATSAKGTAFGLAEALLPLLEPLTARHWNCPYFQVKFDMSWVNWVLTSSNYHKLPEPLLSRCPPVRLRNLTTTELEGFLKREGKRRALSGPAIDAITEALSHPSLRHHQTSLRTAARMLQRAADLEHTPILH